jgi:hypothetical protein
MLDAAEEDGSLGRLINDGVKGANASPKAFIVDGRPRVCFFATSDICPGEEITYSYCKGTKCAYPWRIQVNARFTSINIL